MARKVLASRKRSKESHAALRKLVFRQVGQPGDQATPAIADMQRYVEWLATGKLPPADKSKFTVVQK